MDQAKAAARYWKGLMDASLKDLQTDYVDAYYLMAVDNPALVRSEEVYNAFLKARAAGKRRPVARRSVVSQSTSVWNTSRSPSAEGQTVVDHSRRATRGWPRV